MTTIAAGDALKFYLADRANQAAVDLMLERKRPPDDLSLDELDTYYTAELAANRVQLEFWRLLRTVWAETWGSAMSAIPTATLLSLGEHSEDSGDYRPTKAHAWDYNQTYGVFSLPGKINLRIFTGVFITDDHNAVELACAFAGDDGPYDPGVAASVKWRLDEEDWLVFTPDQPKFTEALSLDLAPFKSSVEEVVELLGQSI